jgi:hypothetical protein
MTSGFCGEVKGSLRAHTDLTFKQPSSLKHGFAFSRRNAPEVCVKPFARKTRAQGMPGAQCARSRACRVENTRVSHHGHTGNHPAFPAQWFYGFLRALPGDRLVDTVASGAASADLTPAPGCQDHTTSPSASASFVKGAATSTASRPASVTIASRPSVGRDGYRYRCDLGQSRSGIFLQIGLDWANHIEALQQIPPCAQVGYARRGGGSRLRLNPPFGTDLPVRQISGVAQVESKRPVQQITPYVREVPDPATRV